MEPVTRRGVAFDDGIRKVTKFGPVQAPLKTALKASLLTPLSALDEAQAKSVGRKAANLGRLLRAGLPVPPGYVLGRDCLSRLLRANGLEETYNDLLSKPSVINRFVKLRALVMQMKIPAEDMRVLGEGMEELGGRLAVSSSAVDEDAGSQSMAGLHASVLDVQSLEALEKAVLECLASSLTYGVYQETQAFGQGIGVIIQRFIPFQWGGVAFSRDPLTGDANTVVLNYGRGPIENIASGRGDNAFLKIDKITKTPETVTTGTGAETGLVDRTCEAAKLGRAAKTNQIAGTHKMDRADNVDGTKKIAKTDKVDPDGAHPDGPCLPTDTVRALVDYLCSHGKIVGLPG